VQIFGILLKDNGVYFEKNSKEWIFYSYEGFVYLFSFFKIGGQMSKKSLRFALLAFIIIGLCTGVMSQTQTGSVVGKVTDEEGISLPGASVSLKGPALMGTLIYITTDNGDFRFPAVPPGSGYVITVELSGFQTISRTEIIVNVGKTVTLTFQLALSTIKEEVIVTGEPPIVDVKSSKLSVSYSTDLIKNVPLDRDFYDVIKTAPGIVSDDVQFHRSFSAHGGTVRANQVTMDGVTMNDPAVGTNMVGLPFDVFEEFEFALGALPAEVGVTEGAFVNIVTKSGGNEFHGHLQAYYFNESMVKSMIPKEEVEAIGLRVPKGYKNWSDYSFTLGGPIIKDKLWFFANARYINFTLGGETLVNGIVETPHKEIQTFTKLTFKPSPNFKFAGMWSFKHWEETILSGFGIDYFTDIAATANVDSAQDNVIQASINWIANQNTFLDLRFNNFQDLDLWLIQPDADPTLPYTVDIVTSVIGGSRIWQDDYTNNYYKLVLSATHFQDNFLGGNHEFKAGVDYLKSSFTWERFKPSPYLQLVANGDPWAFGTGVGLFNAFPIGAKPGDTAPQFLSTRLSAYIQDSFTIADKLTLNLGIRYNESRGTLKGGTFTPAFHPVFAMLCPEVFGGYTLPDLKNAMVWKSWEPRLGVVYDIFGDGKTSIKGSWSRYHEPLLTNYFTWLDYTIPDALVSTWIDLNLNRELDVTDLYIPQHVPVDPRTIKLEEKIDPNLKSPYTDEFILGIEREFFQNFSAGISYIYKKKTRFIEDVEALRGYTKDSGWWVPYSVAEPGWDGQYGTSDDSTVTVYAVKAGAPRSQYIITNPEGAERKYQAIELVFNKRMSNQWQFLGSLTLTKSEGNIGLDYDSTTGASSAFDNPNWLINRYGRLNMDRTVLLKLQGSVILPFDFMLSTFYFHMSGTPWARTLRIFFPPSQEYDPSNPQYVDIMAEAPGSRRYRSRNNLDMRIEKNFTIGSLGKLGIFFDVMNVLGESWFDVEQDPGGWIQPDGTFMKWPSYGTFTGANGLRTYKLSIRLTF